MAHVPMAPELNHPVVVDGIKYRIRSFDTGSQTGWRRMAHLRESFAPRREVDVHADALTWDGVAGVWRVGV